jgi:hypothetical protein
LFGCYGPPDEQDADRSLLTRERQSGLFLEMLEHQRPFAIISSGSFCDARMWLYHSIVPAIATNHITD